jgi:hypothetical protein
MGLDIVEFFMSVEESFDLRIPDEAAVSLTTSRRLIDFLYSQLPQSTENRCLSQHAFYALRGALSERLGLNRSLLRPRTELHAILPRENPNASWVGVGETLDCTRWPRVRGRNWFGRIFQTSRPRTLGEAANYIAIHSPRTVKSSGEGWSWGEVAWVVDQLLYCHFGVRDYSLDDRFIEDLRLD